MLADLGIDRYLQGHEEEFPVQSAREQPEHRAFPESIEHLAPCRAQPGKHLRQPQAAVMSIAREPGTPDGGGDVRSEEHTSELQSRLHLVCRLLLEKKKKNPRPVAVATNNTLPR